MRLSFFVWTFALSVVAAPASSSLPGHVLPPFFRHIGLTPMGAPKLSHTLWSDYEGKVTTIVIPVEEVESNKLNPENTHLHFFIDGGRWELANSQALLKRLGEKVPKRGWMAGWLLSGDVGSMVTNLREFAEFRKRLDALRKDMALYVTCPTVRSPDECLPKSLHPFVQGIVWDLSFRDSAEAACLVKASGCSDRAEAFFARLRESSQEGSSKNWSLRVSLTALAQLGQPLKLLKALYARFMNENHSVHFLLGVDEAVSKKILANEAPFRDVRDWLTQITRWQVQRNSDLGVNIENPFLSEGKSRQPEATMLLKNGLEAAFARPFVLTRFTVTYDPKKPPSRLRVFLDDGDGQYYAQSFSVSVKRRPGGRPSKIFTETLFFPGVRRMVVLAEGGRITGASANGWP